MYTEITTWNECIAIYLSFHMAVSLEDIITLWVEVQRSMIVVDHLFPLKSSGDSMENYSKLPIDKLQQTRA